MNNQNKETSYDSLKTNIWLGAAAGAAYSFFAWGLDTISMGQAHASLPWIKLAIGSLPTILIFILVSWICTKTNHLVVRMLLWMATATGLSYLVSLLTFQVTAQVLRLAHPAVGTAISYITPAGIRGRLFVIIVMTNILFISGGLLFDTASESVFSARSVLGWLIPVVLCLAFFAGAGYVADSNFNTKLRSQIAAIDEQIEEVSQLDLENLSERNQRLVRRFTKLDVDLKGPRKLLLATFDDSFSQVKVLIDFNGTWTECMVLNSYVGNCEMVE